MEERGRGRKLRLVARENRKVEGRPARRMRGRLPCEARSEAPLFDCMVTRTPLLVSQNQRSTGARSSALFLDPQSGPDLRSIKTAPVSSIMVSHKLSMVNYKVVPTVCLN